MRIFTTLLLTLLSSVSTHAENEQPSPPAKSELKKLDATRLQLGHLTIDSQHKTIALPAYVEQNEVLVEYILVNPQGKIHETIFITEASPYNLNVALKLLGFQESQELLRVKDKNFRPTSTFHTATAEQKKHSRLSVSVSWEKDGKNVTRNLSDIVTNHETGKALTNSPWVYNGSYVHKGKLKAELNGDILAIFTDSTSLANYAGEGKENDKIWIPNRKNLPPLGTPVTLTLKKISPKK